MRSGIIPILLVLGPTPNRLGKKLLGVVAILLGVVPVPILSGFIPILMGYLPVLMGTGCW